MFFRMCTLSVVTLLMCLPSFAKDKKKNTLPDFVVKAQTVMVVVNPGSEMPLNDPGENKRAQDDVEQALLKWGRFRLALSPETADLVISVRRGRMVNPAVTGGSAANRPVTIQHPSDGQIRIGGEQGRRPDLSDPGLSSSGPSPSAPNDQARVNTEVGDADDSMAVYRGGTEYPLDSSAVWRYSGHNALLPPTVNAVAQFRKAIEQAEKQQPKQKP